MPLLLQADHPDIIPIPGGSDKGMDGAFSSGSESFCPVVTTTGIDVMANLRNNLNTYKEEFNCRRVIFATSQPLDQNIRKKLIEEAQKLGFDLRGIYDQSAIAQRLYKNPKIANQLLRISGHPPALSIYPRGHRLFIDIAIVGRKQEFDWISNTKENKLLVGQPGIGKSFLLHKLTLTEEALFIVQDNLELIANEIREKNPTTLIIDNAHNNITLLDKIMQMRKDSCFEFNILASCWPNYQEDIKTRAAIPESNILTLERLGRDEMVEVVKEMGIHGPDEHIKFILDMAEGRPGLAAVLVAAYKNGDFHRLNSGEALIDETVRLVKRSEREEVRIILAAFSIGGNHGFSLEDVASAIDSSPIRIRSIITDLSAGGVISSGYNTFYVRPPILRNALIRDVFFSLDNPGLRKLGLNLIATSANPDATAESVFGAKFRGASLENHYLENLLLRCSNTISWQNYAALGRNETDWILDNNPEKITDIAHEALNWNHPRALVSLLQCGIGDTRELHSYPDHPLRQISDWISRANPRTQEPTIRRKALLDIIRNWLNENKDIGIGLKAIELIFSPNFQYSTTDPGAGKTITLTTGVLGATQLRELHREWDEFKNILGELNVVDWSPIQNLIGEWLLPGKGSVTLSDEIYKVVKSTSKAMLSDVILLTKNRLGVQLWAKETSKRNNFALNTTVDPSFELIYGEEPYTEYDDWRKLEEKRSEKIKELGHQLSTKNPKVVSERISFYEEEARLSHLVHHNRAKTLAYSMANSVTNPNKWIKSFLKYEVPSELIYPFLEQTSKSNPYRFTLFSLRYFPFAILNTHQYLIIYDQ